MTDAFLALCSDKRRDRCARALEALQAAVDGAPLYNVDYKDAKDLLGRVVDEAWSAKVRQPFLAGRGFDTAESDFDHYLGSVHNLHDVFARYKKLAKLKPTTKLSTYSRRTFAEVSSEMVAAVTEVLTVAHPVAQMVKDLKAQVVKGRRPSAPSKATLAARAKEADKRTCPCCFRLMALNTDGSVTRHGWQESGGRRVGSYGNVWHSGSCFGVGYKPYEVSCQGTKDFHEALTAQREDMRKGLATLKARPATLSCSYKKGFGSQAEQVSVTLEDDGRALDAVDWTDRPMTHGDYDQPAGTYAYNLKNRIANAESALSAVDSHLAFLAKAVEDWKAA